MGYESDLSEAAAALTRAASEAEAAAWDAVADVAQASWPDAVTAAASTPAERKLLATGARIDPGTDGVTLLAGIGPALSGGLGAGGVGAGAVEYGSTYPALRPRNPEGYVAGPASRALVPEIEAAAAEGFESPLRGTVIDVTGD